MRISRGEDGCLEYTFAADPLEPDRVILFERWESQAALDAHIAAIVATTTVTPRSASVTLYEVAGAPSIGEGARLVASTQTGVELDAQEGEALVRVRWSRWLALSGPGGCLARAGDWVTLRADRPGRYRITGSLAAPGPFCA